MTSRQLSKNIATKRTFSNGNSLYLKTRLRGPKLPDQAKETNLKNSKKFKNAVGASLRKTTALTTKEMKGSGPRAKKARKRANVLFSDA